MEKSGNKEAKSAAATGATKAEIALQKAEDYYAEQLEKAVEEECFSDIKDAVSKIERIRAAIRMTSRG